MRTECYRLKVRLLSLASFLFVAFLYSPPALSALDDAADLKAADQQLQSGKLAEAETSYQSILAKSPNLAPAQVGLVRAMLRQQKLDESLATVNNAIATNSKSAGLSAAKGDVEFRLGKMSEAEHSYLNAKRIDPKEAHAYLGLARLYASFSLYRKAYDQLQIAHTMAPDDVDVQRAWLDILPRKERVLALEAYLAKPHPDDEEDTRVLTDYLDFLHATVDKPIHACKLSSKVERTESKLQTVLKDANHMRGIGLDVQLNHQKAILLLDTGAGGIMVNRKLAERAGLNRISSVHYGGIGDKGDQGGYRAVADHIRIGELEFEDCVVLVSGKRSVDEIDGLIGADVFGTYLIDIDLPGMRLKLSPLPKRPEDTSAQHSLNSEGDEEENADRPQDSMTEPISNEQKPSPPLPKMPHLPKDRYVAPEMTAWTTVFRFGHTILVPTFVNDDPDPMLFGLDTGGFANVLSLRTGRNVGKVTSDDRLRVRGLSGEVSKVYSTRATLRFGHLQQPNMEVVTFDLSPQSRRTGTEISGFLGFSMLRVLEVKLDYRDGLVDFEYDPSRVPHFSTVH